MARGAAIFFNFQYFLLPTAELWMLACRAPSFLLPRGVYSLAVVTRASQDFLCLNPGSTLVPVDWPLVACAVGKAFCSALWPLW